MTNRVLRRRLEGGRDWDQFDAELLEVRSILGGLGQTDRFVGIRDGESFEAVSFRIFDPRDESWNIYWLDNRRWRIEHQVQGGFTAGIGEFFGSVSFQERPIEVRFRWSEVGSEVPRWDQAYRDPATGEWETNWTMEFRAR